MTATTGASQAVGIQNSGGFKLTRKRLIALFMILFGIFMFIQAGATMDPSATTIATLQAGEVDKVPHLIINTFFYVRFTGVLFVLAGALALADLTLRMSQISTILLIIGGVLFVPLPVIVAAIGDSTNITTIVAESLRLATPIAIGAMAGIWCERTGVINIAIEGMMLFAACFGFTAVFFLRLVLPENIGLVLLIGVGIATLSGGIVALLHAWLSITFRIDQIVSGTVINILALGITSFVRREYLLSTEAGLVTLSPVRIPILADLPIIGEAIFNSRPIFYAMFIIIIVTHIVLFNTQWGLRTRAVGEHPHAADTLGINVNRMRWANVFLAGLIAGLAGAWFSLETTGRFNDNMTRGVGFIALAAMIFGKWTPIGAFGAAILFGFSDAVGTRLQILEVSFPVQFLQMVPYVVTIVVLAGFIGRAFPPKAVGKPYVKE